MLKQYIKDMNTEHEYHREPTQAEIKFGEGAIHYRTFKKYECCKNDSTLKQWFIAKDDGLRYYQ